MRHAVISVLVLLFCSAAIADDADDAGAKLYEYFEAFNAQDTQKVANEIYSTPVHIGGGDGHRVLATPEAAVENLENLYDVIKGRGWKESKISSLEICVASDTLALVDTQYSRLNQDGEPIPPTLRTNLYVLQKIDGDWRIVAFYGHDDDKRPACG
jgi:ketosteroid isomerase-like protein